MTPDACPFCQPAETRIAFDTEDVIGLWSDFPTSPGHLLVIPKRHAATWFDATPHEQAALTQAIDKARQTIEAKHRPDGYTIGIDAKGGQAVPHLHVHVIPRYAGTQDPHTTPRLITGGEDDALLPHLIEQLATADQADIAVGFVQQSGVTRLEEHLRDLLQRRRGRLRLLTGDYLGITDPDALTRLLDLEGDRELRVFETWIPPTPERPGPSPVVSFHPKSYAFRRAGGEGVAFVGSSNLSESALTSGIEWNYRVVSSQEGTPFGELIAAFERLFTHPATRTLDRAWIEAYRARRPVTLIRPPADIAIEIQAPPAPNAIQQEALRALEETRLAGHTAGLVVLATGLGKTWLSAFDSDRPGFRRILFVTHREEILGQAIRTFRRIRPAARLGHGSLLSWTSSTTRPPPATASSSAGHRQAYLNSGTVELGSALPATMASMWRTVSGAKRMSPQTLHTWAGTSSITRTRPRRRTVWTTSLESSSPGHPRIEHLITSDLSSAGLLHLGSRGS